MSSYTIKNLVTPTSSKNNARETPYGTLSSYVRKNKYLPVRYSPNENIPKLELGWDDEKYLLLNNEGKLVQFEKEDCDGIEIPVDTEVEVVEIVQSLTGVWYGFVFASSAVDTSVTTQNINLWTADETKVLYARPHYFERVSDIDIPISNNLTKKEIDNSSAEYLKGTKLISPGSNLNWKKLDKYDVKLAYFNFNEFNRNNSDELLYVINQETVQQNPTYRFSEGLYYFISDDGKRKTAAELEAINLEQEQQEEVKSEESTVLAEEIKTKAFDTLLRYLNKSTDNNSVKSVLRNRYFVNVSSYVTTNFSNPKNQKILFAIPAIYVDALPESDLEYGSNFDSNYILDKPFTSGRNYSFTVQLSELEDNVDDLVSVFEKIKEKIQAFRESGGVIKNSNKVDYDIDQQIEALESFPGIIDKFLSRQVAGNTSDDDHISRAMIEGSDTSEDHILQIDIRDNGVVGSGVRETISGVLFSPDNEYLSDISQLNLYELDPWLLEEEYSNPEKAKRSGIELRKAIPWLRSKFQGVQGTRTLHYLMAQKNMISFSNQADKNEIKLDEWIKYLQSFTVPPLQIQLTKDKKTKENTQEEVDCVKLLEEFASEGPILTAAQRDRQQAILNSPQCREAWRQAKQKNTSTFESTFTKAAVLGQSEVVGEVTQDSDMEALKSIYEGLLHNLNPQALMALLLSCLQSRLGIEMTAEGLCRAAIEGIIKEIGGDAFLESLKESNPDLNVDSISSLPQSQGNSEALEADVIFRDSPVAKSVYLSTGNLRAARNIQNIEDSGGVVETIPAEYALPSGQSETYSNSRLETERSNLISLGFSDEQSSALMIQKGLLKTGPTQVNYVEGEYDLFTQGRRYDGTSDYGDYVETSRFLDELISLNGLEALCEAIVGPLLELPGNFLANPEGYIQEFRFPDFSIPTIPMPDSLMTDDLIGNYGDLLLNAFLGLVGSMLGQLLGALLEELITSCFEEPELPGRAGKPNRSVTLPLPSFDGVDLGIPPDKAKDWVNDLLNNFTPSQICALLKGDASHSTVEAILERTREHNPTIFGEANLESAVDIITTFKKIGENINLDICDLVDATLPALDACDTSYDYEARCAELQAAGLTQEECEKQVKDELEDLKNKIISLSSFLFPNSNPLDGIIPDACGPQGLFVLPPAVKDSMAELTDHILTYIKRSMIEDLRTLEFFSMPPRAVMAAADPDEMAAATSKIVDATFDEPLHAMALTFIGGEFVGENAGSYRTSQRDYHLTYSAANHYVDNSEVEEALKNFKPQAKAGPKNDPNILQSVTYEPLTYLNFTDSTEADIFRHMMQFFLLPDQRAAIHSIASSIGINPDIFYDYVNAQGENIPGSFSRLEEARSGLEESYDKWTAATEARIALEESYDIFVNKDDDWEVIMMQQEQKLQTARGLGVIAASVISYGLSLNPAHLLGLIDAFWVSISGAWDKLREVVEEGFKERNAIREEWWRREWAEDNITPHIEEQKRLELEWKEIYDFALVNYKQEERGLREVVNRINEEIKAKSKESPLPMGVENYYFTLEMFFRWQVSGITIDQETGDIRIGPMVVADPDSGNSGVGYPYPPGIDYRYILGPTSTPAFHPQPVEDSILAMAHPLHSTLKNIHPNPIMWRNMLRMYTGVREPAGVFVHEDELDESIWTVRPNSLVVTTSPGIKHLSDLANGAYQGNIIEAFMNLSVEDACGLTNKRRRIMYPKMRDRLEGVVFQKSSYNFETIISADVDLRVLNIEGFVKFMFNEYDPNGWTASIDSSKELMEQDPDAHLYIQSASLIAAQASAMLSFTSAEMVGIYTEYAFKQMPIDFLLFLSDKGYISYSLKTISLNNDSSWGYVPVFGVFKKYVRDPDNPWEQDAKTLISATSLEDRLVNEKLYQKLVDQSIYPKAFDASFSENLGNHLKMESEKLDWSPVASEFYGGNFNSNVLKYDLPDNSIISSDPTARIQIEKVMEVYKNSLSPSPSIQEALDNLSAINANRSLIYQNTIIPRGESFNIEKDGLQDLSCLAKGKILTGQELSEPNPTVIVTPVPPPPRTIENDTVAPLNVTVYSTIDNSQKIVTVPVGSTYMLAIDESLNDPSQTQEQPEPAEPITQKPIPVNYIESNQSILESKYNFNIQNTYDEDVQQLLEKIGLDSSEKFDEKFDHLNGWFSTSVSDLKLNSKAIVFAELLKYKLKNLLEDYSKDGLSEESIQKRDNLLNKISFGLSTHGYSALQFAYSNQMFVKLKNSRLHYRKYLRKLWKKILKSQYVSNEINEQCDKIFRDLGAAAGSKRDETDFFDLESVKPSIIEFYENSICRDVYDKAPEGHNAVKDSLIEGSIMLLVKIYVLEMCLASIVSWDSFDVSDVFSDRVMVKVVVDNMRKDVGNFDLLVNYANDIIRKLEDTEDQELFLLTNRVSSIEYLIIQESREISKTIKSLFVNSSPLTTNIDLDVTLSTDDSPHWTQQEKIFYNHMSTTGSLANDERQEGYQYVTDVRFTNNIYTMNYGGVLEGPRSETPYRSKSNAKTVYNNNSEVSSRRIDLFGMSKIIQAQGSSQKLAFYSLPVTNHSAWLISPTWPDKWKVTSPWSPNNPLEEGKIYTDDYHVPSVALKEASSSDQNRYESLFANEYNLKLGNVTFHPYVRIVDTRPADLQGKYAQYNSFGETPAGEPCDDDPIANQINLSAEIPLPFLAWYRNENNLFNCKIYDYVPLEVWNYFYNNVFLKEIQKKEKYRVIFEQYGLEPFFKEIKFGIRMSYSIEDKLIWTPGDYDEIVEELVGHDNLKRVKSIQNLRRALDQSSVELTRWVFAQGWPELTEDQTSTLDRIKQLQEGVANLRNALEMQRGQIGYHITAHIFLNQIEIFEQEIANLQAGANMPEHLSPPIDGSPMGTILGNGEDYLIAGYTYENGNILYIHWGLTEGEFREKIESGEIVDSRSLPISAATSEKIVSSATLKSELQIPIVEVEKSLELLPNGFRHPGGDLVPYNQLGYFVEDKKDMSPDITIAHIISQDYSETVKSIINCPSQYFYRHVASDLFTELKDTAEFRLMYNHLFPMNRYMAIAFLYSGDSISKFIPEPTEVLYETKTAILRTLDGLYTSDSFTYDPSEGDASLESALNYGALGTRAENAPEPDITSVLMKIIFMTPLLILKGLVEIADPAISFSKKIIDIAAAVSAAVISGIESGLRVAKAAAEQAKLTAQVGLSNAEIAAQSAGIPVTVSWAALDQLPGGPELKTTVFGPDAVLDLSLPIVDWKIPEELQVQQPQDLEEGEDVIQPGYDIPPEAEEVFSQLMEGLEGARLAQNTYADALSVYNTAVTTVDDIQKQLDEAVAKAKEITNAAFSSPFALQGVWTSLLPSTLPFFGGLVPFGGLPSTLPGMIYLALMYLDMVEMKQHDDSQLSEEQDCDDQL